MPFTASKADERVLGGLIRGIGAGTHVHAYLFEGEAGLPTNEQHCVLRRLCCARAQESRLVVFAEAVSSRRAATTPTCKACHCLTSRRKRALARTRFER